jgi:hypothetical protein
MFKLIFVLIGISILIYLILKNNKDLNINDLERNTVCDFEVKGSKCNPDCSDAFKNAMHTDKY